MIANNGDISANFWMLQILVNMREYRWIEGAVGNMRTKRGWGRFLHTILLAGVWVRISREGRWNRACEGAVSYNHITWLLRLPQGGQGTYTTSTTHKRSMRADATIKDPHLRISSWRQCATLTSTLGPPKQYSATTSGKLISGWLSGKPSCVW